jgi:hypothetical protein
MAATKSRPADRLAPYQVCFVVEDVGQAVAEVRTRFGWGPFRCFRAKVETLRYRGRPASRDAEVALGMAGAVQVELLHVHEGVDCLAAYQTRYGCGFQHLGVDTGDRDAALRRLEALGGKLDHLDEFEGIRIAFVDGPVGPGLFELVDRTSGAPSGAGASLPEPGPTPGVAIDRATVVTDRMETALDYFAGAFGWRDVTASTETLRTEDREVRLARALGRAGRLEIELVEGLPDGRDPYSRHLVRGDHGLVHAGGVVNEIDPLASPVHHWVEADERFVLADWSGGVGALQLRLA